jgi:transposase
VLADIGSPVFTAGADSSRSGHRRQGVLGRRLPRDAAQARNHGRDPSKSDQIAARKRRGRKGGRPPGPDVEACKGRNVVERSFALAKQWRALATRYDKLAITYRAAALLTACITWTRI